MLYEDMKRVQIVYAKQCDTADMADYTLLLKQPFEEFYKMVSRISSCIGKITHRGNFWDKNHSIWMSYEGDRTPQSCMHTSVIDWQIAHST